MMKTVTHDGVWYGSVDLPLLPWIFLLPEYHLEDIFETPIPMPSTPPDFDLPLRVLYSPLHSFFIIFFKTTLLIHTHHHIAISMTSMHPLNHSRKKWFSTGSRNLKSHHLHLHYRIFSTVVVCKITERLRSQSD